VHTFPSLQIKDAFRTVVTQLPVVRLQAEDVQLLEAVQTLGVYEHVPVRGLHVADVQLSGALQTTGVFMQFP